MFRFLMHLELIFDCIGDRKPGLFQFFQLDYLSPNTFVEQSIRQPSFEMSVQEESLAAFGRSPLSSRASERRVRCAPQLNTCFASARSTCWERAKRRSLFASRHPELLWQVQCHLCGHWRSTACPAGLRWKRTRGKLVPNMPVELAAVLCPFAVIDHSLITAVCQVLCHNRAGESLALGVVSQMPPNALSFPALHCLDM